MLEEIIAAAHRNLAVRENQVPLSEVKATARRAPEPRDGRAALRQGPGAVSIIAELKRRSPSKGALATISDPKRLATAYEDGGAALISCMTEPDFFGGDLADLKQVRAAVSIPVIYKDFVVSPYQIHEARAHGADMVLLLVEALAQPQLEAFIERIDSLGMSALVEVHSRLEVCRALDAGAQAIGVNARSWSTYQVDRANFAQVVDLVPAEVVAVAESGVRGPHDVFEYAQAGADAVLVGESLVTSDDPRQLVADMVSAGSHPALQTDRKARVQRTVLGNQIHHYHQR
ncbi:MAG: indole-3-glycerol phosphate synthase TrpC [Actinomycetaceae bacterium]|nr:indole-3-glycerol phosphate synthase TrpC [Actinomycetaceae bacterium]